MKGIPARLTVPARLDSAPCIEPRLRTRRSQKRALRAETPRATPHPHQHRARSGRRRDHAAPRSTWRPTSSVARRSRPTSRRPTSRARASSCRWACDNGIRVLLPVSREDGLLDWAPYDGDDEDVRPPRHARPRRANCSGRSPSTTSTSSSCPPPASTARACGWDGAAATSTRRSDRWRAARPSTP